MRQGSGSGVVHGGPLPMWDALAFKCCTVVNSIGPERLTFQAGRPSVDSCCPPPVCGACGCLGVRSFESACWRMF